MAGFTTSLILSLVCRYFFSDSLLPTFIYLTALTAPLTGMTEELVYRGFIQGILSHRHPLTGILAASAGQIYSPLIAHGLFDFLLFTGGIYSLLSVPVFLAFGALFIMMLRRARQLSPFKTMVGELLVACPQCGQQVPYYAGFCARCGQPLVEAKQNSPVFCGKCGAAINREATFCTSCGSRLLRKPSGP